MATSYTIPRQGEQPYLILIIHYHRWPECVRVGVLPYEAGCVRVSACVCIHKLFTWRLYQLYTCVIITEFTSGDAQEIRCSFRKCNHLPIFKTLSTPYWSICLFTTNELVYLETFSQKTIKTNIKVFSFGLFYGQW